MTHQTIRVWYGSMTNRYNELAERVVSVCHTAIPYEYDLVHHIAHEYGVVFIINYYIFQKAFFWLYTMILNQLFKEIQFLEVIKVRNVLYFNEDHILFS